MLEAARRIHAHMYARIWVVSFCLVLLAACSSPSEERSQKAQSVLRLATTTSVVDSGLFKALLPAFEKKYNIKVRILSKGTGEALRLARAGEADAVLIHAREAEDDFVASGYGINRKDVMYNDFVLLGPRHDPANVRGETSILAVMKRIAERQEVFVSRGDNSGTHLREMGLWTLTGIEPQGQWYQKAEQGMLATLQMASTRNAYVLSDRSTYLSNQKALDLVVVSEGDRHLFNSYGVIAVNPLRMKDVNYTSAMRFIDFITSREGQAIIRAYGLEHFGRPLFVPVAID